MKCDECQYLVRLGKNGTPWTCKISKREVGVFPNFKQIDCPTNEEIVKWQKEEIEKIKKEIHEKHLEIIKLNQTLGEFEMFLYETESEIEKSKFKNPIECFECDAWGERAIHDELNDDEPICKECFDKFYTICSFCSTLVRDDELTSCENCGTEMCDYCQGEPCCE